MGLTALGSMRYQVPGAFGMQQVRRYHSLPWLTPSGNREGGVWYQAKAEEVGSNHV